MFAGAKGLFISAERKRRKREKSLLFSNIYFFFLFFRNWFRKPPYPPGRDRGEASESLASPQYGLEFPEMGPISQAGILVLVLVWGVWPSRRFLCGFWG
jgi:hypothetical protein